MLCEVPVNSAPAKKWVEECRARNLFIRDAGTMGNHLGERFVRIAVKDLATTRKMLKILNEVKGGLENGGGPISELEKFG